MNKLFKLIFLSILVCISLSINGQNLANKIGLKYGHWTDTTEDHAGHPKSVRSGMLKIVPLSNYNIKDKSAVLMEVFYKNSTSYLFTDNIVSDSISVQDGLWKTSDLTGNLLDETYYQEGILMWSKEYDGKNAITFAGYIDYDSGTDMATKYSKSRVYYTQLSNLRKPYDTKRIYYPDDNLIIEDAEPSMLCNFLNKAIDTCKLKLSSKTKIDVEKMISSTDNIQVLDKFYKPVSLPITIPPGQQLTLNLLYQPKPYTINKNEFVTFTTNDSINTDYQINIETFAYHFGYPEVEKLEKLTLSIAKDKFLIIPRLGTFTHITFSDLEKERDIKTLQINEQINRIDLSQFEPGKYYINIGSCNTGGNMLLTLKE